MTIKELRKKLRGLDENMQIYISNSDHNEWETDALTYAVDVRNQDEFKEELEQDRVGLQPTIKGDYLVITG